MKRGLHGHHRFRVSIMDRVGFTVVLGLRTALIFSSIFLEIESNLFIHVYACVISYWEGFHCR